MVDRGKDAYDRARTNVSNITDAPSTSGPTGTTTGPSGFPNTNPTNRV